MRVSACALAFIVSLSLTASVSAQTAALTGLTVEPGEITLHHGDDVHRLMASGKLGDGTIRDVSRSATFRSADSAVATVSSSGLVRPVGPGRTTVQVAVSGLTAAIRVTVKTANPAPVSFGHDVMPILAKAGCNSGACHGAASGKRGFKISLRGYDPAADYPTLTRGTIGRRLDLLRPEQSLLLLKPTGQTPHEGGKRFDLNSGYGKTLKRWIVEGAQSDLMTAPQLVGIEVTPTFRSFPQPKLEQQLLVRARYSDGRLRDVTGDARYSSSNDSAAEVDEAGLVRMPNKGEAAIMVRYGPFVAISHFVVLKHDPAFVWSNPPEANYIDTHIHNKLKAMEILPSPLCTDEEFLRRVSYDVIGLPPTVAEVRAFRADARPDKRARKIDELLDRPEHAEFWASKWADLLKVRFELLRDKGTWGLYRWLRDSVAANKRFDRFVHELLTADGSCNASPAANYWRVFTTPEDAAEGTAQVFLGIRVLCAKCHDHPFEKWVQKDYYGLSAFFSQVSRKPAPREDLVVFRNGAAASSRHPNTGESLTPKYLDGAAVPVKEDQDARIVLADWLTRKDNPFLAKATVNRLWSHLFGRGIIDPVDDIRSSNPPVNAPLLDALTKDFLTHDFDVRYLLRTMLNSRAYQASARTNPFNSEDRQNFSHYVPRRLSAEQLLDTVVQITGIPEGFRARFPATGQISLPVGGVRAGSLPDRGMTTDLLDLFGKPRGESSCACERNDEASMTQALHLINGAGIASRLANPGGKLAAVTRTAGITDEQIIEEVYLLVLCRSPHQHEIPPVKKYFTTLGKRPEAAQDLMWALVNSKEFLFNH